MPSYIVDGETPFAALITGGAGFIGSNFIRCFLSRYPQAQVIILDLLTYAGNLASLESLQDDERCDFVHGDIADGKLLQKIFATYRPTCVFNFAAESHVDRSIDSPDAFIQTNVVGTANLLRNALAYWGELETNARQAFRFLHVSTDEVYGSLGPTGKFTETTRYQPNSPYSASKAASDHLVRAYHLTYGLPTLISNCSNNYGPYQYPEKLIPLMTLRALDGKPLPVYGDGANVRDWLFVTDHCSALMELQRSGSPGEVYNIGGDAERSNLEVVRTICQVVDELCPNLPHGPCETLIQFVKDRPGHDRRYAIDATKIQSETAWKPAVTFDEGIRQTVRWYLERRDWVDTVSVSQERDRIGLPQRNGSQQARQPLVAQTQATEIYVDGEIHDVVVKPLQKFSDSRGWLIELFREDELDRAFHPMMAYVSQTEAGITRGPHEHVEQTDHFAFIGPGNFQLVLWDSRPDSASYGRKSTQVFGESNPATVVVPAGIVHAYRNVSSYPGLVFNAPNKLFAGSGRLEPVDEIRHEDQQDSPYRLDSARES